MGKLSMGKKLKKIIAVLLALLMVVSVCSPVSGGNTVSTVHADGSMTITNLKVLYEENGEWKGLIAGSTIADGTRVKVSFDWDGSNLDKANSATVDLGVSNLNLDTKEKYELKDKSGTVMGTYTIKNGKFTVDIDSGYRNSNSDIKGDATLDGSVTADNSNNEASKTVDIKVNGQTYSVTMTFNQTESSLNVSKTAQGAAKANTTGGYTQTYEVKLTANYGNVTVTGLTDTCGNLLTAATSYSYNGGTYTSLDDLVQVIGTIGKDNSVTFTYDMAVGSGILAQGAANSENAANKITATYTTNMSTTGKTSESTAYVNIDYPTVEKNGTYDSNTGYITWTITIKPGVVDWDSVVDLNSLTDQWYETIGSSNGKETNVPLDNEKFTTSDGGKTYTATYTTPVSDTAKNSTSKVTATNDVKGIKIGGYEYTATNTVSIKDATWAEKSCETTALGNDKILTWKVSVTIPQAATSMEIADTLYTRSTGNQVFDTTNMQVYLVGATSNTLVADYNSQNNAAEVKETDVLASVWSDYSRQYKINLKGTYVESNRGETVSFLFQTKVTDTDSSGKTYINQVTAKTADDSSTASAEYKDTTTDLTGKWLKDSYNEASDTTKSNDDLVYYVWIDFAKNTSITPEAGKKIVFTDILPENMTFDSVEYVGYGSVDGWFDTNNITAGSVAVSNNILTYSTTQNSNGNEQVTFNVTLNDTMINAINNTKTNLSSSSYGVYVQYKIKIKDGMKAYQNKSSEGTLSLTNSVTATYDDGAVGGETVTSKLKPDDLVDKTMTYLESSPDTISYTIDINPHGYTLNNGNDISCSDDMGDSLILDKNTVRFIICDSDGTVKTIIALWSYDSKTKTYKPAGVTGYDNIVWNYDELNNQIACTVPDETHIKITYDVSLQLYSNTNSSLSQAMTFQNSGNTFTMTRLASSDTRDEVKKYAYAYTSNVTGTSQTGSITLLKYYTASDGTKKALGGSSFKVYEATYDATTKQYTYNTTSKPKTFVSLRDDETQWKITGLQLDQVYVLVETGAASGYKVSNPIYFVLPGKDYANVTQTSQLQTIKTTSYLRYENEPAGFTVEKTINGSTSGLASYDAFSFTLKKGTPTIDATSGKCTAFTVDATWPGETIKSDTTTGEASFKEIIYDSNDNGTTYCYQVSEDKGSERGMTYDSSYYIITSIIKPTPTGGSYVATNTVKKYKADGTEISGTYNVTELSFDNTETGNLTISKKVVASAGTDTALQTAVSGKKFTVYIKNSKNEYIDEDGSTTDSNGTSYTDATKPKIEVKAGKSVTISNLPVGNYTIEEDTSGTTVSGYVGPSVSISGTDVTTTNGTTTNGTTTAVVKKGATTTATITNTYTKTTYQKTGTSATFGATKTVTNKTLEEKEYTFTLTAVDDSKKPLGSAAIQATNDATGAVTFDAIPYTAAGTYYYSISEQTSTNAGIVCDTTVYYVKTVVTYDASAKAYTAAQYRFTGGTNDLLTSGTNWTAYTSGSITFANYATKISVSKTDTAGTALLKATLQIVNKATGAEVVSWESGSEPYELVAKLAPGVEYVLKETKAPDGYEVASDITLKLSDDGRTLLIYNATTQAWETATNNTVVMVDTKETTAETTTTEATTTEATTTEATTQTTTTEITTQATVTTTATTTTETVTTTEDTEETEDTEDDETSTTSEPKTGDEAPIVPMVILLILSAAGAVLAAFITKKRNRKQ